MLRLFGYGSLMHAPELPERVVERRPARLDGHRRTFNKRSVARGCAAAAAFDVPDAPGPRFEEGERRLSLALGTEAHEGGRLTGMVLGYPDEVAADVLAATDRREGFDPSADRAICGYVRAEVTVTTDAGPLRAWTWLSNPDPACPWTVDRGLTVATRARILIEATPRRPTPKVRGLRYLEAARDTLRAHGIEDPRLEELAAAARAWDGPWRDLVAPPSSRQPAP